MLRVSVSLTCSIVVSFAGIASAGPVTWDYAGEITSIRDDDNLFDGAITIGSPFSCYFTFESTTSDASPTTPTSGFFQDAIIESAGQIGDIMFLGAIEPGTTLIRVLNTDDIDSYVAHVSVNVLGQDAFVRLGFRDNSSAVFTSDLLPLIPPSLDTLDFTGFALATGAETFDNDGTLTTLVPEPTTLALFGLGIISLFARRVRKAREAP